MAKALHLFIFGPGYSAEYIARAAQRIGYKVSATYRREEQRGLLEAQAIVAYPFAAIPSEVLASATHILSSIPPDTEGDAVLNDYGNAWHGQTPWLGYLSTTGVYGDHQGGWVNEATPPRPYNPRLMRRVEAEAHWQALGGHIFRLAGIYGPGRSAIDQVRAGTARRIDKPGQVFSRIHVEDIAQTVLASMQQPNPGRIYNVCDDEAASASDVVAYACNLLNSPVPPLISFAEAELSPMAREFYQASRRVENNRIKQELGMQLRYPTYREGLQSLA